MRLRNRAGRTVDPWPFVVVAGCGCLLVLSYGPVYLLRLGLTPTRAVAGSLLVAAAAVAGAYHRFVRTARPERRAEIPPAARLRRIVLGAVLLGALFVLLGLPLAAGWRLG